MLRYPRRWDRSYRGLAEYVSNLGSKRSLHNHFDADARCGRRKTENLRCAEAAIAMAASEGTLLMQLAETLDLVWPHPSAGQLAEVIPCGDPHQRLSNASGQYGVFVVAGLTERDHDKVFDSAILIDDSRQCLRRHRMLNEWEIGQRWYGQGDCLSVAHTSLGTSGVMICDAGSPRQVALDR
ncbi:nitrilase-related carbon-nitrogen hydrolase [Aureliella helgolandensis]|uniref:nitrilase-related carbon-nitrogen hydrolase n=1 Tax=Aureliella helgolandensis TaxID=2527968 RepID=UPI0021BC7D5F|nr:nitrilase-related carbon-nitrogen hydrolase [Aureliella helgolandensis]